MIIKNQQVALEQSLILRFEYPEKFGISIFTSGILFIDAFESLVATNEWDWLTRDALTDTIYRSNLFELEDCYLNYLNKHSTHARNSILSSTPYSGILYFPDAKPPEFSLSEQGFIDIFPDNLWGQMLTERRSRNLSQIRSFYTTFDRATIVGWALSGDLKSVDIRWTSTEQLDSDVQIVAINDDVLLVKGISIDLLSVTTATAELERIRQIQIYIWIKETLYMEDPGMQSNAAANLYKLLPQKDVELLLLPFLENSDPDVRVNVLTALGMPAYKVGFVPGASLPPRGLRLEPVTIQPSTLCILLKVLKKETNQNVLDNFVCILSSQSFEGKLQQYIDEVRISIYELMPRLESQQSLRDCAEIIDSLPIDG
jgi:hypothetical protein